LKRILIVGHVIFPARYPRAYRTTELAMELARQGHDVTVYAVLGNYDYTSFEFEHKLKVKNIGRMIFVKLNSDGVTHNNIINRILNKLLNKLLEFPDIELMFKIPRILKSEKNFDLLISVAVPFPIHWGCALSKNSAKQSFPKVWAADCGDPYMGSEFIRHPFYFRYIEKWFCKKTDFITVPTENIINAYYSEFKNKIRVIPQGFKFDDQEYAKVFVRNPVPTFAYAGNFFKNKRDPTLFLNHLSSLTTNFKFIIYTHNDDLIHPYYNRLKDKIEVRPYIERKQLLVELSKMDFLIHIENIHNYGSPSKLIDYAIVKRPILSIASNSLPVGIINEFFEGNYGNQFIVRNLEQYDISNVARQFASLNGKSDPGS
jgi:hypothetical protein